MPGRNIRSYSAASWNDFHRDYHRGYRPDVAFLMDYGVFDCHQMDKKYFPDVTFVLEAGDTPQSFQMNALKAPKFPYV